MRYFLDTCALIWWTVDYDQLSPKVKKILNSEQCTGIVVSSISLWEIGVKLKNGKLDIGMNLDLFVEKLQLIDNLEILPVTLDDWLGNVKLNWSHRDPADRTIVSMAMGLNLPLITKDQIIKRFYKKVIW